MTAQSPPSRGAWIEIQKVGEGHLEIFSRPPRGGRGLKSMYGVAEVGDCGRPPRGGRGLK